MKPHPFEKYRWNRYGFEVGQELEWFEWLFKYRDAIKQYKKSMEDDRFSCDETLQRYIQIKEELVYIRGLICAYIPTMQFRPYHLSFMKSNKIDAVDKVRLKNNLLKAYENSEHKDGKYYLSIANIKVNN